MTTTLNRRLFMAMVAGVAASVASGDAAAQYSGYSPPAPPPPGPLTARHDTLASGSTAPVGVQLALAMDTSGSMNNEEFEIELQATAAALNSRIVRNAIKFKGGDNSVAICLIDFDGTAQVRIPWVDIRGDEINEKPYDPGRPLESSASPDKLDALVAEIQSLPRRGSGGTTIEAAMDMARDMMAVCPWAALEKRVLDVFGDGSSSQVAIAQRRDAMAQGGITINGFAIVNDEPALDEFFRQHLVTRQIIRAPDGIQSEQGRVWAVARNMPVTQQNTNGLRSYFNDVAEGMKQKLSIEVAGLEVYRRALADAGERMPFPVPRPVGRMPS